MSWIETARRVLANMQHEEIDEGNGPMIFDLQSAHVMVTVHDALNETNRAKLAAMPVLKAQAVAFQLAKGKS